MKRFRKIALLAGLMAAAWVASPAQEARAGVHIDLGFFAPAPPVYYYPAPVYPYPVYRHYHYGPRFHYHHHHHRPHHHGWCW